MDGEERDFRKLDFREREVVLRADFGELDTENCLTVSVRFIVRGPRHPRAGEWVYLLDSRGHGCLGRVESIDGWMARIRPDWESWSGGQKPPLEDAGRPRPPLAGGGPRALRPGLSF